MEECSLCHTQQPVVPYDFRLWPVIHLGKTNYPAQQVNLCTACHTTVEAELVARKRAPEPLSLQLRRACFVATRFFRALDWKRVRPGARYPFTSYWDKWRFLRLRDSFRLYPIVERVVAMHLSVAHPSQQEADQMRPTSTLGRATPGQEGTGDD